MSYTKVDMNTWDKDALRARNKKAFGVQKNEFGSAWREGKVGDIYQDETYYIEPNFQWLEKINGGNGKIIGGQNMKSRISGIGLKVTKIEGESIWGRDEKVKWSDLRGNNSWKMKGKNEIEGGKRTIHVQRVAYFNQGAGTSKKAIDLGQGVCMLKLPRSNGAVYLVVGVAKLASDLKENRQRRVKWDNESGFVDEGWKVCFGIGELVKKNPTFVVNGYENRNSNGIRVDSKSSILIGNQEGKVVSWLSNKNKGRELVAIVLGVAVKYDKWWEGGFKDKGENTKIKDRGWVEEVKCGSGKGLKLRSNKAKDGIIECKPEEKWESIGEWKSSASAKFTWTGEK